MNQATTKERIIRILRKELPFLKEKYGVEKIVLYGSFAKGTQRTTQKDIKKASCGILFPYR
mgnify:CR=1 FL=1